MWHISREAMPYAAILLCTQPGISLQVLYCLAKLGVATHIVASQRAWHLRLSRYAASFSYDELDLSESGLASLREKIERIKDRHRIDIIIPGDAHATRVLIKLTAETPLDCFPLPDEPTFDLLADKWSFYQFCLVHGVSTPQTSFNADMSALRETFARGELRYPCVIKPTDQGNGNGVVVAETAQELSRAVLDNPNYRYAPLIVQEFIPGEDLDCSLLARSGEVICFAVQQRRGAKIVFDSNPDLVEMCSRIVRASKFTGVAHFDGRRDARDGRLVLIECNPRFWASITAAARCGMNFVAEGIADALAPKSGVERATLTEGYDVSPTRLLLGIVMLQGFASLMVSGIRSGLTQTLRDPLPWLFEEWFNLLG